MRAFVVFENPDLKEGVNYRIPSAARFKEWRSFLGPVCHYISVSVIKLAVRTHLLHDATTKDGISVFQTTARVEIPREGREGTIWVEMPVKFDLLPSGDAETEAKLVAATKKAEAASLRKVKTAWVQRWWWLAGRKRSGGRTAAVEKEEPPRL